jgi:hypothetical protein
VSGGNSFNNAVRASSPPAEAPTPTIGKKLTFPPETARVFAFWLLLGIPSRFTTKRNRFCSPEARHDTKSGAFASGAVNEKVIEFLGYNPFTGTKA